MLDWQAHVNEAKHILAKYAPKEEPKKDGEEAEQK